ncbi:MAG: hypothetical protein JNJ43_19345 [Anaerolineales bacterium]|nr:hypothetical protein [Anaerolineales bacterium]
MDEAALRKRAASKGDLVVEVKDGAVITGINVGWELDKFIDLPKAEGKKEKVEKKGKATAKKVVAKKPVKVRAKPVKKKASKPSKSKPAKKSKSAKKKKK